MPTGPTKHPWWRWPLGFLLLLAGVLVVAWLARKPLVTFAVQQWCASKDLSCNFQIETLEPGRILVQDVAVSSAEAPKIVNAKSISVDLTWPGFLRPEPVSVTVLEPHVVAALDDNGLSFGGLERIFAAPSQSRTSDLNPDITIESGSLNLKTPAGVLSGQFAVRGNLRERGEADVSIGPADLEQAGRSLSLENATAHIVRDGDTLTGKVDLRVNQLSFDDIRAEAIDLHLDIPGATSPRVLWQATAGSLEHNTQFSVSNLESQGEARLTGPLFVEDLTMSAAIGPSNWQGQALQAATLSAVLKRKSITAIEVELESRLQTLSGNIASGEALNLTFSGETNGLFTAISGTGQLVATDISLHADQRRNLLTSVSAGEPFAGHARALKNSLDKALSAFSTGAQFRIDATSPEDWRVIMSETLALQSASGLRATLAPHEGRPILTADTGSIALSGLFTLQGGGSPTLSADIDQIVLKDDALKLRTGGLTLKPWRARNTWIGAALNTVELERRGPDLLVSTVGELTLDGDVLGAQLTNARLFGGIDAVRSQNQWRIQTQGQDCFGFQLDGANARGGLSLQPVSLNLCPEGGRVLQYEAGQPSGQINLGDVDLPFSTREVSGTAGLKSAILNWQAGDAIQFDLRATEIDLPLTIGGRAMAFQATQPEVAIDLHGTPTVRAELGLTQMSGEMIPALIDMQSFRLDGRFPETGFAGQATGQDVRISDYRDDPLYNPLLGTFAAQIEGTEIRLNGPIQLEAREQTVADASLTFDLVSLDGIGKLAMRPLTFTPRGLQPKHLSDRVRDLLSNGRGGLSGDADFMIQRGKITGTGTLNINAFGFDTQRLGAVDGINGEITFSDLIGLTTEPGQRVTVGQIRPGIPLNNGELVFQIIEGEQARIERARWPFAGGQLELLPSVWTISGSSDVLTVKATNIELSDLIEALTLPDIEAEGTVSGEFPIRLENGNALIENAVLSADEKGGVIRYIGAAGEKAGQGDSRVEAAFTALRDLRYTVFEIGLNGNLIDKVTISARLLGKNPDVYAGAEFDFRISIASQLAQLLRTGRETASTDWLTEVIANGVEPDPDAPFN